MPLVANHQDWRQADRPDEVGRNRHICYLNASGYRLGPMGQEFCHHRHRHRHRLMLVLA